MLILCASCQAYSDAWMPFSTLFQRFWPDCPYRRVLFSDRPEPMVEIPGFEFLQIADDGWIRNLLKMLAMYPDQNVAVFQEDFFICYPVKTDVVDRLDRWLETTNYAMCRLYPCPGANDEVEIVPGVGAITQYSPYRASCQVAIWRRVDLMELCRRLLNNGYTKIQDFELQGSRLIDDFRLCGWIRKEVGHPSDWPLCYHCSAIAAGKWMQGAVEFCKQQNVPLSNKRGIIFGSSADEAILKGDYYEWLARCATGEIQP